MGIGLDTALLVTEQTRVCLEDAIDKALLPTQKMPFWRLYGKIEALLRREGLNKDEFNSFLLYLINSGMMMAINDPEGIVSLTVADLDEIWRQKKGIDSGFQ